MQQVTGIHVDHEDHIWFLNRAAAAEGDEIGGDGNPPRIDCCVRGPEVIELDQDGKVVHAWGGPGYHPLWPTALQTVIADRQGFVWVGGTAPQDSILKFTRDGKFVWDFGHRPPQGAQLPENNQQTDVLVSKGRFQIDEVAREIYIINWKRVLVYDMDTGAFKRGWGGHGMPLSEISNEPTPPYKWTGAPPPAEKNFVPDLHFLEISRDRRVYVGERGQNRIEVFTTDGKWLQEFYVAPNTPARGEGCGGLNNTKMPPCGTTYKLAISRDPAQKYLYVADGTNNRVWILDRQSGKTLGSFGGNGRYAGPAPLDQRDRDGLEGQHLHGRSGAGEANPEVRAGDEVACEYECSSRRALGRTMWLFKPDTPVRLDWPTAFKLHDEDAYGRIRCPMCEWRPGPSSSWCCSRVDRPEGFYGGCGTVWNTFSTHGRCPGCQYQWRWTKCLRCDGWSQHEDWYAEPEEPR